MAEAEALLLEKPRLTAPCSELTKNISDLTAMGKEETASSVGLRNISPATNGTVPQKSKNAKKPKKSLSKPVGEVEESNYEKDKVVETSNSPYSDIDSVPQIRRCPTSSERTSKQSASNRQANSNASQHPLTNDPEVKKNFENQGGLWFSKAGKSQVNGALGRGGIKSVNCSFGKVSCKIKMPDSASVKTKDITGLEHLSVEAKKALDRRVKCLPASSRLMTRALKAMEEAEHKTQLSNQSQGSTSNVEAQNSSDFTETEKTGVGSCVTSQKLATTPRHDLKEDSKIDMHAPSSSDLQSLEDDEHLVKSEDESSLISPSVSMKFKHENHVSSLSSSSSASSLHLKMEDLENMKEITFKSLDKDYNKSFRPDVNYKFSTFLMLLKDMHDSREQEGKPLIMEPLPKNHLIKEEPSSIPTNDIKDESNKINTVVSQCKQTKIFTAKQKKSGGKSGKSKAMEILQGGTANSVISENHLTSTVSKNAQSKKVQSLENRKTSVVTAMTQNPYYKVIPEHQLASPETFTKFSVNVPKKRWQKFNQVSDRELHLDEGNRTQEERQLGVLSSENCDILMDDTNKSSSPGKESHTNASETSQSNCQINNIPTGIGKNEDGYL